VSTAEALKILNNNSTGRVYSEQEAREVVMPFWQKMAKIVIAEKQKQPAHMRVLK
tara:strand:- start:1524 stop:1688 length:165 start_codon:yes stop_codon:yes gene_type:complete